MHKGHELVNSELCKGSGYLQSQGHATHVRLHLCTLRDVKVASPPTATQYILVTFRIRFVGRDTWYVDLYYNNCTLLLCQFSFTRATLLNLHCISTAQNIHVHKSTASLVKVVLLILLCRLYTTQLFAVINVYVCISMYAGVYTTVVIVPNDSCNRARNHSRPYIGPKPSTLIPQTNPPYNTSV